jgi:hypothetical protein
MRRLISLIVIVFAVSILGVVAMKATVVFMAEMFYGGKYAWDLYDAKDAIVKGMSLGLAFSVFLIANFIKASKKSI